jgi:TonB-dependent SusC/RagA subfamily outer membrane receptor
MVRLDTRLVQTMLSAVTLVFVPAPAFSAHTANSRYIANTSFQDPKASQVGVLDRRIDFSVRDVTLEEALTELGRRAHLGLAFSPSLLPRDRKVTCACKGFTIRKSLDHILAGLPLRYGVFLGHILIQPPTESAEGDSAALQVAAVEARVAEAVPWLPANVRLQSGGIIGRIVDAPSGQPLVAVQVQLAEANIGATTGTSGRYLIQDAVAGQHTILLNRLGYATVAREVTVRAGETVIADFEMHASPLALDEIVVTGTAGQARRREVGNAIAQINLVDAAELAPNVEAILQAQSPGVSVLQTGGSSGAGAHIRLRGNASVSMGNQPLIYVDGVRLRSDSYPRNRPAEGFTGRGSDAFFSPLNEMNPQDIERIEIIKGPAATTLYGTEAAAGVIQIFTKRGTIGRPIWTAQMDQGFDRPRKFGPPPEPYMRLDDLLRTGWRQKYGLSLNGGSEALRYFVSAAFEDNEGILPNDWDRKVSARANFGIDPLDNLHLDYHTSFTINDISNTPTGNNSNGVTAIALRAQNSALGATWRENIHRILEWDIHNTHNHLITGLTASHTTRAGISNRVTIGLNRLTAEMRNVRPFGFILDRLGVVSNRQWTNETINLDWTTNLDWRPISQLQSTLSFGAQFVQTREINVEAYSDRLPGPGIPTVSSGALKSAAEDRIAVRTGGFFVQNLLGYEDRYFLTLGVRVDGNSAFGEDFGLQAYPKASLAYIISDEPFWPDDLGEMKVRLAYGHAGRAPGAFDAVRTWAPVGSGGEPAFLPSTVGNPSLGPERTSEIEFGFDAGLLDHRLAIEFTHYRRETDDALFPVRQTPSNGFSGSQLENVGKMRNGGFELAIRGTPVARPWFRWDVGVSLATNHSKVLDLGGAPSFSVGNNAWIIEGHPTPVIIGTKLNNPDEIAEPDLRFNHAFGPNFPTHTIGVSTTLRLMRGIQFAARGDFNGGHYISMDGIRNTTTRAAWPECEVRAYEMLRAGQRDQLTAYERAMCDAAHVPINLPIYPADFFRLRELSLRVPVPVVTGLDNATFTLAARNAWTWLNDEFRAFDPEMTGRVGEGLNSLARSIWENYPAPATVTASLRVVF